MSPDQEAHLGEERSLRSPSFSLEPALGFQSHSSPQRRYPTLPHFSHVTATNIGLVKSLGAEGAALTSPSGKKYDAVVHCAPPIPWSVFEPNLSSNGKVIDVSSMLTFAVKKLTFSKKQLVPIVLLIPKGESLQYLVDLVRQGKLQTVIDSRTPLSKAGDAWTKSIDGHATGKIVIEP
ncbi:chloroplast envelope quinone oxidoreductase homolog [Salvia miltiorrhiza]|uniref:chloroplast envelope quinone oxidoreductase homolog n=1 Tax=Salvia miltiorrhiza TaxID=226208 RepID=UPI0025ACB1DD|nr:chloroplast envelope quinone oxidoreductase homolog [Salvia miltiorrhiza]